MRRKAFQINDLEAPVAYPIAPSRPRIPGIASAEVRTAFVSMGNLHEHVHPSAKPDVVRLGFCYERRHAERTCEGRFIHDVTSGC